MTAELTAEEIVTNLLSSHEILKKKNCNFSATSCLNLSEYLKNLPSEDIDNDKTPSPTFNLGEGTNKYTFIKDGGWGF